MAFEGFGYIKGLRKKRSVAFREPLVSMDSASDHPSPSAEIPMASGSSGIVEGSPHERSLLSTGVKSEDFVRIDMPPSPSRAPTMVSSLGSPSEVHGGSSSSSRGLPPKPKSKYQSGTLNMEEAAILALGGLQAPPLESSFLRSNPLTRQVDTISRATSMPARSIPPSHSSSIEDSYIALNSNVSGNLPKGVGEELPIYRSHSVPAPYTDGTIRDNHVRILRVVPNIRMFERERALSNASSVHNDKEGQDAITEDEAVCRICFEELGEELDAFKLECNCKGDLALVHLECCQRWFNLRGNRICEICRSEVQNINVKVSRRPTIDPSSVNHLQAQQPPPMVEADRLWQEFPILVVASIVGYFLSVKFFQMWRRSDKEITGMYGIPSSCILGLLTSLAASSFAQRKHVWIYALVQFLIFTVFAQIFYNLLRVDTLPTILFSTTLAMGIGRGVRPVYLGIKKLRAARQNQLEDNPEAGNQPAELQSSQETA